MGQILASLKHDLKEARRYLRALADGKDPDPMISWVAAFSREGRGPLLPSINHETFEKQADEVIALFDRLSALHAPTPPPATLTRLISQLRGRNTPRVESGGYVESFVDGEWRIVGRLGDVPPVSNVDHRPTAPVLLLDAGCKRCGEPRGPRDGETCAPCVREMQRKAAA